MAVQHLSAEALPLEDFPKPLRRHVDPKAPPPLRDMGAKGLVPGISPEHLAMVLFQLQFDADPSFRTTAGETFAGLPPEMKQTIASAALPEAVLDFCARRWHTDEDLVQRLLANAACSDVSVAWMANHAEAKVADIIADQQVRFLRAPLIIEQLYLNPNTRQSSLDRVLELARREKVDFAGLPGLRGVAAAHEHDARAEDDKAGADDDSFAELLKSSVVQAEEEEAAGKTAAEIDEEIEQEKKSTKTLQAQLNDMNIAQRIRLATLGSKEARALLIRDPNRLVHMAAVTSPKVTMKDIYDYADNKNLSDNIINFIANRKEAVRDYQLLMRLTRNPKLHLKQALRMINYLRPNDLKSLSRDRNVSPQLQKMAKNLLQKRVSGRRG